MATITSVSNTASATFNGNVTQSAPAVTQLTLDPTIEKTVDKSTASIGEILTYTITIGNESEVPITNVTFTDTLPVGTNYVTGSFTVDGVSFTPSISGSTISYQIPSIEGAGNTVISLQAMVVGGEI